MQHALISATPLEAEFGKFVALMGTDNKTDFKALYGFYSSDRATFEGKILAKLHNVNAAYRLHVFYVITFIHDPEHFETLIPHISDVEKAAMGNDLLKFWGDGESNLSVGEFKEMVSKIKLLLTTMNITIVKSNLVVIDHNRAGPYYVVLNVIDAKYRNSNAPFAFLENVVAGIF